MKRTSLYAEIQNGAHTALSGFLVCALHFRSVVAKCELMNQKARVPLYFCLFLLSTALTKAKRWPC